MLLQENTSVINNVYDASSLFSFVREPAWLWHT